MNPLIVPWKIEQYNDLQPGAIIHLLTPEDFKELFDGAVVYNIFGKKYIKGVDEIDLDTRFGRLAFGILAK